MCPDACGDLWVCAAPEACVIFPLFSSSLPIFFLKVARGKDQPEILVRWYDYTKRALDRVDGFPKNQRFVLGTRLADAVVKVLELLGEAVYAEREKKRELLDEANRKIEVVRWLVRLCMDRNLISNRQFLHSAKGLEECGRMVGGWARSLGGSTNGGGGTRMRS